MGTIRKQFVGNKYETNCDGYVEILETDGKCAKVKFINTGYETQVLVSNLMAGKCRDYSITNRVYAETNQAFKNACAKASTPPTKRQASKFRRGLGKAWKALQNK